MSHVLFVMTCRRPASVLLAILGVVTICTTYRMARQSGKPLQRYLRRYSPTTISSSCKCEFKDLDHRKLTQPSCICSNACIDPSTNRLILFGESASSVGIDRNWTLNIAGRLLPEYERYRKKEQYDMYASRNDGLIEPRIVLAPKASWKWDIRTLVIARRFSAYNMGHVMTETAIPLIRLMMLSGVGREQSKSSDAVAVSDAKKIRDGGVLYLNDSCSDDQDRWVANGGSHACTEMSESFLFPIVKENIQRDRQSSADVRCFRRAAFGHNRFNYFTHGRDKNLAAEHRARRAYRDILYQNNGLEPPEPLSPDSVRGLGITVLVKTGKRAFSNYHEIRQYLERQWATICGSTSSISFIDLSTSS
jgi:hypothetical protein